jgi:hypothetical protein
MEAGVNTYLGTLSTDIGDLAHDIYLASTDEPSEGPGQRMEWARMLREWADELESGEDAPEAPGI